MKLKAMAVKMAIIAGFRLWARTKPIGTRKRPMAKQNAGNVWRAGSTANFIIAAQTTPPAGPRANAIEPPYARSPFGESNSTTIATKTIAEAPFGQAVATQKSSTAPIATKARVALTTELNQSGALSRKPRAPGEGWP